MRDVDEPLRLPCVLRVQTGVSYVQLAVCLSARGSRVSLKTNLKKKCDGNSVPSFGIHIGERVRSRGLSASWGGSRMWVLTHFLPSPRRRDDPSERSHPQNEAQMRGPHFRRILLFACFRACPAHHARRTKRRVHLLHCPFHLVKRRVNEEAHRQLALVMWATGGPK